MSNATDILLAAILRLEESDDIRPGLSCLDTLLHVLATEDFPSELIDRVKAARAEVDNDRPGAITLLLQILSDWPPDPLPDSDSDRLPAIGEILEPASVDEFWRLDNQIWNDLVQAHTNLALIRKSREYPRTLLRGAGPFVAYQEFQWFELSVIVLHRILNDQSGDALSFAYLRRFAREHVRAEFKEEFRWRLRNSKLTEEQRRALAKIADWRHKHIAHKLRLPNLEEAERAAGITLSEMQAALNAALIQYESVRPGVSAHAIYDGHVDALEDMLDATVLASRWSQTYDEDPTRWERTFRPRLGPGYLDALNTIRARNHLPPIPNVQPDA